MDGTCARVSGTAGERTWPRGADVEQRADCLPERGGKSGSGHTMSTDNMKKKGYTPPASSTTTHSTLTSPSSALSVQASSPGRFSAPGAKVDGLVASTPHRAALFRPRDGRVPDRISSLAPRCAGCKDFRDVQQWPAHA